MSLFWEKKTDRKRLWDSGRPIWTWDKDKPDENYEAALRRIKGSQCKIIDDRVVNSDFMLASVTGRVKVCSLMIRPGPKEHQEIRQFADHE